MLASIHPLGERARNTRFAVTTGFYLAGSTAGGTLTGAALGTLGSWVLPSLAPATVAAPALLFALVGAAFDLGAARLPSWRRQVNEDWLTTYRGWVYGAGFGFQLGMGLVTIVTSAAIYLTFLLAFLSQTWLQGALLGFVFGLARSLPLLAVTRVTTIERLRRVHRQMQRLAGVAHRSAVAAQLVVAAVALGVVVWR